MLPGQNSPGFDIKVFRLNQVFKIQNVAIKPDPRDENKIITFKNNSKIILASIDSSSLENYLCWNGSYFQIATSFGYLNFKQIKLFLSTIF